MYHQHVKEKEARAQQVSMVCHLGRPDVHSGSEKDITPENKWVEKHFQSFQWTDREQFVSVDDKNVGTSCAMESPPDAHSDDDDDDDDEEEEESSEEEHEW
jgi:hypothetical protein